VNLVIELVIVIIFILILFTNLNSMINNCIQNIMRRRVSLKVFYYLFILLLDNNTVNWTNYSYIYTNYYHKLLLLTYKSVYRSIIFLNILILLSKIRRGKSLFFVYLFNFFNIGTSNIYDKTVGETLKLYNNFSHKFFVLKKDQKYIVTILFCRRQKFEKITRDNETSSQIKRPANSSTFSYLSTELSSPVSPWQTTDTNGTNQSRWKPNKTPQPHRKKPKRSNSIQQIILTLLGSAGS